MADLITRKNLSRFKHQLPVKEIRIARMVLRGMQQHRIGKLFGCTQAAISYRLDRLRRRLKWLLSRPARPASFRDDLLKVFQGDAVKADVVLRLTENPHQSDVALEKGMPQGRVRRWFYEAQKKLRGPSRAYVQHIEWNILNPFLSPKEGRKLTDAPLARNPAHCLWKAARKRSAVRNKQVPFTIRTSDVRIPSRCPVTRKPFSSNYKDRFSPTLATIQDSLGYVPGNIWVISRTAANRHAEQAQRDALFLTLKGMLETPQPYRAVQLQQAIRVLKKRR